MTFLMTLVLYVTFTAFTFTLVPRIKNDTLAMFVKVALIAILAFMSYTRPLYFRDTTAYIQSYEMAQWESLSHVNLLSKDPVTTSEYGFSFLMLVFKWLGLSFRCFSACMLVLFVLVCYRWMRIAVAYLNSASGTEATFFLAFFALFLPIYGFFYGFVAIRGMVSFALLAMASAEAMKGKHAYSILWFVAAFSVQRFAIIGVIPIAIIVLARQGLPKMIFVLLWLLLGILILVEFKTGLVINSVGIVIQGIWNRLMTTDLVLGVKSQSGALKRLLLFVSYWFNGLAFILAYNRKREYGLYYLIYIALLALAVLFCQYTASYRVVDYLYMYMIPLNYTAVLDDGENTWFVRIIVIFTSLMFILSWGASYYQWMFE